MKVRKQQKGELSFCRQKEKCSTSSVLQVLFCNINQVC
jgi:hypothetical protein